MGFEQWITETTKGLVCQYCGDEYPMSLWASWDVPIKEDEREQLYKTYRYAHGCYYARFSEHCDANGLNPRFTLAPFELLGCSLKS